MENLSKDSLREYARGFRNDLSADRKKAMDAMLSQSIINSELYRSNSVILAFYPLKKEPDILPVISDALKSGRKLFLPKTGPGCAMRFYAVDSPGGLVKGNFGIMEPSGGEAYDAKYGGLCLVPGLVFDRRGYRAGYGKGFYDRFLPSFMGVSAGICYEGLFFEHINQDIYDARVDLIYTERRIIPVENR